ncbi:unnamed protein product [Cercospora beticola]|nr:unnamed protein product [Cercospora beticola]
MASTFHVTWSGGNCTSMFQDQRFQLSTEELQQLLQQRKAHEDGLSRSLALLEAIPGTQIVAQQLRTEIRAVQSSAAALHTHLDRMWGLLPLLMRPADGALAEKVFGTPELLEEILMYLPTRQKLACMRVQRKWYQAVEGSVKLKRSLGLEPAIDNFYNSPFGFARSSYDFLDYKFPGGGGWLTSQDRAEIFHGYSWSDYDDESDARNLFLHGTFTVPNKKQIIGSRVGNMRITSPPIQTLSATVHCECQWKLPSSDHGFHKSAATLRAPSPAGFTVQELQDSLIEFAEEHSRTCRSTAYTRASFSIELSATLLLHEDDPVCIFRRQLSDLRRANRNPPEREYQIEEGEELTAQDDEISQGGASSGWGYDTGTDQENNEDGPLSSADLAQAWSGLQRVAEGASGVENDGQAQISDRRVNDSLDSDHKSSRALLQGDEERGWDAEHQVDITPW